MGIFDHITRAFNVGGARIAIDLGEGDLHQGDVLDGTVVIQGGDYDQEARHLRVALVEYWTETRSTGKSSHRVTVTHTQEDLILAQPCIIAAKATTSHAFRLHLPHTARLSDSDEGWRIDVELDVPGQIDPRGQEKFTVLPSRNHLALVELLVGHLRFTQGKTWYRKSQGVTAIRCIPPPELKSEVDHVDLIAQDGPESLSGTLAVNLQEQGIGDYLKSIFGLDVRKEDFHISHARIATDPTGVARELSEILATAIQRR